MEKLAKNYISELSTGVLVLDKSLSIQYLNSSAQSMLDISLKASRKKQLNKIFYEQPDSFQNFKSCLTDNRDFAKADALLFLKGGKKLLCDYHIHPFSNLSLGKVYPLSNFQLIHARNHPNFEKRNGIDIPDYFPRENRL